MRLLTSLDSVPSTPSLVHGVQLKWRSSECHSSCHRSDKHTVQCLRTSTFSSMYIWIHTLALSRPTTATEKHTYMWWCVSPWCCENHHRKFGHSEWTQWKKRYDICWESAAQRESVKEKQKTNFFIKLPHRREKKKQINRKKTKRYWDFVFYWN